MRPKNTHCAVVGLFNGSLILALFGKSLGAMHDLLTLGILRHRDFERPPKAASERRWGSKARHFMADIVTMASLGYILGNANTDMARFGLGGFRKVVEGSSQELHS